MEGFNLALISDQAVDELIGIMHNGTDKTKMIFSDMLRLLVLQHEGDGDASELKYLPAPDS